MIVADVTFYPIGKGISVADTIREAITGLRSEGLKCYPNSMATVIETDTVEHLFSGISKVEASLVKAGFSRVETIIRIDHRVDVENTVARKLNAIGEPSK